MADNITVTPGVGATIAAANVAGVLFQKVKLTVGPGDTAVDASEGTGATDGGTLRIVTATDGPLGAQADAVASTDTGTASLVALTKRSLQYMSNTSPVPISSTDLGAVSDVAAANGTVNASAIAELKALVIAAQDTSDVNVKGPPTSVVGVAVPGANTTAYANGNCVGTLITFPGVVRAANTKCLIQEVVIQSKSAQSFPCDIVVFNSLPTATVDHAAFSVATADATKFAFRVPVANTDWCPSAISCFADPQFNPKIGLAVDGNYYVQIVARGAVTLSSNTDLTLVLKGSPD